MSRLAAPLPSTLRRLALPMLDALAAPHGIERYLEQWNPMWSLSELRARVVAVQRETADCVSLTLRPNRRWKGYRAGQYVRVRVEVDGVRRSRCYSITASEHRADGLVSITVKLDPGGRVSTYLNRRVLESIVIGMSQAEGSFCLPEHRPERLLFISGGSGITPMMGLLRTLCDEGHGGRISLLHYAPTPEDVIFGEELRMLAVAHPNLQLLLSYTRAPQAGESGRFSAAQLRRLVPDYARCSSYVCGPSGLIAAVESLWAAEGLSASLQVERFAAAAPAAVTGAAGGELRFARSERAVHNDGRTLLEQAEAAGLRPESGCRMGICHSCTCRKTHGTVRNLRSGAVSREGAEDIQLCISVPVGDVALDL